MHSYGFFDIIPLLILGSNMMTFEDEEMVK